MHLPSSAPSSNTPIAASQPDSDEAFAPRIEHAQAHQRLLKTAGENKRLPSDRELEEKVKVRLADLAHQAKDMMESQAWKKDVWLSQLDWTPKVAGKSRGVIPPEVRIFDNTTRT